MPRERSESTWAEERARGIDPQEASTKGGQGCAEGSESELRWLAYVDEEGEAGLSGWSMWQDDDAEGDERAVWATEGLAWARSGREEGGW